MIKSELELNVLDVVGEGGYSFRELSDTIRRYSEQDVPLGEVLGSLLQARLIYVYVVDPDGLVRDLTGEEALNSVREVDAIIAQEIRSRVSHYVAVTSDGKKALSDAGITY